MTISDDEREAREWLRNADCGAHGYAERAKHRATILALLDRPVMPRPEEVPVKVIARMNAIHAEMSMRAAIQVLHDWCTKPAEPRKVEAWAVVTKCGNRFLYTHRRLAEAAAENAIEPRIVHLREVEASDD